MQPIIVDAHLDLAWNALTFGRDYSRPALVTRQLEHGTETPQRAGVVRPFARRGLIKAAGIAKHDDFLTLPPYYPVIDYFLFDAQAPKDGMPGGNALAFDWKIMKDAQVEKPWFLAGGLTPLNVKEAIQVSGADLLDVSSGVESRPGLKDPLLIAQFLAAAEV